MMGGRVVFLLEGTGLYGGVKVVLQQAELLAEQGLDVTVVAKEARPSWYSLKVEFRKVPSFSPVFLPSADLTVATFWTTVEPALSIPWGRKVHYCQGFEGHYAQGTEVEPSILKTYALPIPTWVVNPSLGNLLEARFGRPTFLLPPPLDPFFRPKRRKPEPRGMPRVLVMGSFDFQWKGVATALQAVLIMRSRGLPVELWRISQFPLTQEERRLLQPDRYFESLTPHQTAQVVRQCDLLLAPSWEEGFGLPLLEAMASGVPAVASDIDAFRFLAGGVVPLVPPKDPYALAEAAMDLLQSPSRWRAVREAGLERAKEFSRLEAARRIREAVCWVFEGTFEGDKGANVGAI
ncbi:hypothetical protein EG19_10805 [Thermoanaerobaculum aquaticum]|uniref:Glycosyl transferase family 1 domain-containing protein n=2 Tax=Thermoanaerobaculum aquaticum TaxID=1312852 RepID=A0A062Y2J6_9BACT|nr:hypothetical protein EG19_10805 [Thermoanaerobaculum aquaticum]